MCDGQGSAGLTAAAACAARAWTARLDHIGLRFLLRTIPLTKPQQKSAWAARAGPWV